MVPIHGIFARYGSINVPITSAGAVLYGITLMVLPQDYFSAPVYHGPFDMLPKMLWGIAFTVAGVLALAIRWAWAVLPLLTVVSAWTIAVVIASLTLDRVAPTAGIGWAIICTQLLTSVALRGTTHPSAERK